VVLEERAPGLRGWLWAARREPGNERGAAPRATRPSRGRATSRTRDRGVRIAAASKAAEQGELRGIGLMARTSLAHRPVSGGSFGKRQARPLGYGGGVSALRGGPWPPRRRWPWPRRAPLSSPWAIRSRSVRLDRGHHTDESQSDFVAAADSAPFIAAARDSFDPSIPTRICFHKLPPSNSGGPHYTLQGVKRTLWGQPARGSAT